MTAPTIVKVPTRQIVLVRDGSRFTPAVGKADKFTKAEIDDIAKADPEALRDPTDESMSAHDLEGGSDQEDGSGDGKEGKTALDEKTTGDKSGKAGKAAAASKTADDEGL